MIHSKTEVTKLKPKAFQVVECLNASVNVELRSEATISVVGDKHHSHPIIACVTRNLFRATAIYNIHNFCISCRVFEVQANACRTRQKKILFIWRKRDATFHLRVLR